MCGVASPKSYPTLWPHGLYPSRLPVYGISQAGTLSGLATSSPRNLPHPGTDSAPSYLQAASAFGGLIHCRTLTTDRKSYMYMIYII